MSRFDFNNSGDSVGMVILRQIVTVIFIGVLCLAGYGYILLAEYLGATR